MLYINFNFRQLTLCKLVNCMPDVSETLPPEGHWVAPPVRAMKQKNKTESFISILFPRSDHLSLLFYEK